MILGRPFLRTAQATINVGKGEIKFNINGESTLFKFRRRFEVCRSVEEDEARRRKIVSDVYTRHWTEQIKVGLKDLSQALMGGNPGIFTVFKVISLIV